MMLEKTQKLVDNAKKLMEKYMDQMIDSSTIKYMDPEQLKLIQDSMTLIDQSYELAIEQAKVIDEQSKKLDKILSLLEKQSEEA